eukprot:5044717-Amphidinium_carterae.1
MTPWIARRGQAHLHGKYQLSDRGLMLSYMGRRDSKVMGNSKSEAVNVSSWGGNGPQDSCIVTT